MAQSGMLQWLIKLWFALTYRGCCNPPHLSIGLEFFCVHVQRYSRINLMITLGWISKLRIRSFFFFHSMSVEEERKGWVEERPMLWVSFNLLSAGPQHFSFCELIFYKESIAKGTLLGYCSFWCVLFWKEGAFYLGDREMKRISFRKAVLVPNLCIVKVQN